MKKYLLALAASVLTSFGYAVGTEGDIRSIDAVPLTANWTTPKTVGETFFVRVRLLNYKWDDALNPSGSAHPWVIERNGVPYPTLPSALNDVLYRPALRLAIGARKVNAVLAEIGPEGEMNGLNPQNDFYTDFYFSYQVKEGDLGLPVRLVNTEDKIITSAAEAGSAGFYLVNVNTKNHSGGYWNLISETSPAQTALFKFGPAQPDPNPFDYRAYPDVGGERMSYDQVSPGVMVQTIDFAGADSDAWREIYKGSSDVVGAAPAVTGFGSTSATEATTVYIWSEDESVVIPVGTTEEVKHPDGKTRHVLKVTLPGKVSTAQEVPTTVFKLKGADTAAIGATTKIHLCSAKSPATHGTGILVEGSTITRTVKVVEDTRKPSVQVCFDDAEPTSAKFKTLETSMKQTMDLAEDAQALYVWLSEPTEHDITVKLNIKNLGDSAVDPLQNGNIGISKNGSVFNKEALADTVFKIKAGEQTAIAYIYPLGGDKTTEVGLELTVSFVDPADAAFYEGEQIPATLRVKRAPSPTIVTPAFGEHIGTVSVLDGFKLPLQLGACYRDLNISEGFAVEVKCKGSTLYDKPDILFQEGSPTDLEINEGFRDDPANPVQTATIKVTTPDGRVATSEFTFTVSSFTATPTLFETDDPTATGVNKGVVNEGEALNIRAVLSTASEETLYAYLRPADAATEALVEVSEDGAEINPNSAYPLVSDLISLKLLDGNGATPPTTKVKLNLVLAKTATWTDDPDEIVETYSCRDLSFAVANVQPTVLSVTRDGTTIVDGGTISVASSTEIFFTVNVIDPGAQDLADPDNPIEVKWWFPEAENPQLEGQGDIFEEGFVDADGKMTTENLVFPDENTTYKGYILIRDRDDANYGTGIWDVSASKFSFNVKAGKEPVIQVELPAGNSSGVFYENSLDNYFTIKPSVMPSFSPTVNKPFRVRLTVKPYNNDDGQILIYNADDEDPVPAETIEVLFTKKGQYTAGKTIRIASTDQNGGSDNGGSRFKIYTQVLNTELQDGIPLKDFFTKGDQPSGQTYLRMVNTAPTLKLMPGDYHTFALGATNRWTAGETITLKWTASDILRDLKSGNFTIEWDLLDADNNASVTVTDEMITGDKPLAATATGEYKFVVPDTPFMTVHVHANDGEGGLSEELEFFIQVAQTKKIAITTLGPSLQSATPYIHAKGIGQGHIYVEDSTGQNSIRQFRQTWYYNEAAKQAHVYATGYAADDPADDGKLGTLDGYIGAALTPAGNKAVAAPYYQNTTGLNNYFYRWAEVSQEGEVKLITPSPAQNRTIVSDRRFLLDNEKPDEGTSYGTVEVEAIFSKEYRPNDFLGDINADGIPDVIVSRYALGGSTVGTVPEDDLASLSAENPDNDYLLTLAKNRFGSYIPGVKESWVDERAAFDAKLELRGFHDGLNDAAVKLGIQGVELHPDYNSDDIELRKAARDYSEAEMMAWAETGYAKEWSPENPTDPTLYDTDGDKLPDGYEYYLWYWATVGNIVDGKLVHFTGEKYNPLHPEKGDPISWQEIAKKMDPNVPNTAYGDDVDLIDSDNDGLVDMLEFELGTNPFHWDSDGDGLPDGYEVMLTNLDPHKASTNGSTADGARNDDGDFMATLTVKYMNVIGTINPDEGNANEQGHVKYYATYSSIGETDFAIDLTPENMKTGWRLAVNGVQYMIADGSLAADKVYREVTVDGTTKYYLADDFNRADAFEIRSEEGVWLRGAGACLMKGALLEGEPTQAEWTVKTMARSLSGTDEDFAERSYSVWVYGKNGNYVLAGNADLPAGTIVVETHRMTDVTLLHHHVYQRRGFYFDEGDKFLLETYGGGLTNRRDMGTGFNPTTAWFKNNSGLVAGRYITPVETTPGVAVTAKAGRATDTEGFSLMDEFLLMNWRYHCGLLGADALVADIPGGKTYEKIWSSCSTRGCFTEESGRAQAEAADTDGDGVPDGWELYVAAGSGTADNLFVNSVSFSPNNAVGEPPKDVNLDPITGDPAPQAPGFGYLSEFCGTDSMAAYAACPSVPSVHPAVPGWLNKFFPTDPWSNDTDMDGVTDDEEASFIYGSPVDNGKFWFAGAGMNPCSWDTDMDGLPDPWEYQYKGVYATPNNLVQLNAVQTQDYKRHIAHKEGDSFFVGGMDPTTPDSYTERVSGNDQIVPALADNKDFDYDGLDPWQEYLTGFIRAFRYDDPLSPWKVPQLADFERTDAEYLESLLTGKALNPLLSGGSNPNLVFGKFDVWGAYGSKCHRDWDLAHGLWYFFPDGPNHCLKIPVSVGGETTNIYGVELMKKGYDSGDLFYMGAPTQYATCDPRMKDSDMDGMDDYYELFHGLNPLYGGETGYDLIRLAWPCMVSARKNYWTEEFKDVARGNSDEAKLYDFAYFPWMAGDPEADPDGDDIRNVDEAIQANTQAVRTWLHTDPSPLWMTDSSYAGSIVNAYYAFPTANDQVAADAPVAITPPGGVETVELPIPEKLPYGHRWLLVTAYNWEFEENEGYDSDHDGLSDYQEATSKASAQSDPQDEDDPHRRQAMYFPGENSALQAKTDPIFGAYGSEFFFLEFTVECWVRPEDTSREQVILERTIKTSSSNAGDLRFYRRNFQIGINAAGQFYAAYDHNGTGEPRVIATAQNVAAINAWSHLAATYDGTMLRLYVNGEVAAKQPSTLHPATPAITNLTGIDYSWLISTLEWNNTLGHEIMNLAEENAIIIGASAVEGVEDASALTLTPDTSKWEAYGSFYKGFIDEVRIWDGARTEKEIAANYNVRFTAEECLANRKAVFNAWKDGAHRHVDTSEMATKLPAELAYHYTFDNLLAAAAPENVATSPYGFTAEIGVGGKALVTRPEGYVNAWWFALPTHSAVYNEYAYIPWIPNTMTHLPRFDKTTMDSVYWSEDYAGFVSALSINQTKFDFPKTHELFVNYKPVRTGLGAQNTREMIIGEYDGIPDDLYDAYRFANRVAKNYTTDLLPLGGAYARFCTDLWDDEGATTNTDVTHNDDDNDLLADWWEKLVVAGGKDGVVYTTIDGSELTLEGLKADTVIKRNGVMMSAIEAYHRDLAGGAVEIGDESYLASTQYRQTVDEDKDGIPDWWEQLYGIDTRSADDADADPDGDGLSNFQEYLITEVFRYANLNPLLPRSDGYTLDYLLKVGELYFGEIFTDHDGMDNAWEKAFDKPDYVNRYKYDPNLDEDEDGWSNYAEYRAGTDPTLVEKFSIDGYMLPEHPVPVVKANIAYNANHAILAPLVFMAWNEAYDPDMTSAPDAIWTIGSGDTSSASSSSSSTDNDANLLEHEKFLGRKPANEKTLYLTGGAIVEGSIKVMTLDKGYGIVHYNPTTGRYTSVESGEPDKAVWYYNIMDRDGKLVLIGNALDLDETVIGSVNYVTGEITIDFGHEQLVGEGLAIPPTTTSTQNKENDVIYHFINLDNSYVKIEWKSTKAGSTAAGTYYLADADKPTAEVASRGYLREGKATFLAFIDEDGDGKYTPGEFFGVARGVDVGWFGATLDLELTETHPVFARVDLSSAMNDREQNYGNESGNWTNVIAGTTSGGKYERVRVVRTIVDGTPLNKTEVAAVVPNGNRVVMDKWIDVKNARSYLHEGDFLSDLAFDLDWSTLTSDCKFPIKYKPAVRWDTTGKPTAYGSEVSLPGCEVVYRIVLGNGTIDLNATNNIVGVAIARSFDASQVKPEICADLVPGVCYQARPTFSWSLDNRNSYTAFKIQIADADLMKAGKTFDQARVYESGLTRLPAAKTLPGRTADVYTWTADPIVGNQTALAKVLGRAGNWKWRVSVYNAKFKTDNWSDTGSFSTAVNLQQEVDDHGYGLINVSVKYPGPEAVLKDCDKLTQTKGIVRVQAFESADFAGTPAAETVVTNRMALTDIVDRSANAQLCGLKPGRYFVRAYVDTDGDLKKADWESSGFARTAATVVSTGVAPTVELYIDDADTDNDSLPDAWEYAKYGNLTKENAYVQPDGDIVLATMTYTAITNGTIGLPKNFPSASLQFFRNFDAARLLLGLAVAETTGDSLADIRAAVEKNVKPGSVKVTSLELDTTNSRVKLTVVGDLENSIAGNLLGPAYVIPQGTRLRVRVLRKSSLVESEWTLAGSYPITVSTAIETTLTVDVKEDLSKAGFYKVEVVKESDVLKETNN